MSIGQCDTGLAGRMPLERIGEACRRLCVSRLWVYGPILDHAPSPTEDVKFLVDFINDDFGPWGSKLDVLENDLSGVMHRRAHVALRGGIRDSTLSPWREQILDPAVLIYES
jgi:predicted nucleotidyltransferase